MTLAAGIKLGRYEIRSQLGAGGMGEVYRARDEKLNRDVAIKVLPASLSQDTERLRRFEQEAQAVGALNHPNILAVYDVGTHDGAPYIVSELLEGEELRDALNEGALPVRKAMDYGQQIASGLAAAHEKGINVLSWDESGNALFLQSSQSFPIEIVRLDVGSGRRQPWKALSAADPAGIDAPPRVQITPKGDVFAYSVRRVQSTLYVVEGLK